MLNVVCSNVFLSCHGAPHKLAGAREPLRLASGASSVPPWGHAGGFFQKKAGWRLPKTNP